MVENDLPKLPELVRIVDALKVKMCFMYVFLTPPVVSILHSAFFCSVFGYMTMSVYRVAIWAPDGAQSGRF